MIANNINYHSQQFSRRLFSGAKIMKNAFVFALLLTLSISAPPLFAQEQESENAANIAVLEQTSSAQTAQIDSTHFRLYIGYSSIGVGAAFNLYRPIEVNFLSDYFLSSLDYGLAITSDALLAAFFGLRLTYPLPTDYHSSVSLGASTTWGLTAGESFALFAGYQYEKWHLELGYSYGGRYDYKTESNFFIRAGVDHFYARDHERAVRTQAERTASTGHPVREKKRTRVFRSGIEINYPVHRSEFESELVNELFENEFPYIAAGAGLFFRMGPEPVYFTTGAYVKIDELYREGAVNVGPLLGLPSFLPINIPVDIWWTRFYAEVPLLLSISTGQVRFVGGALLDFYLGSELYVEVLNDGVINWNNLETMEERFDESPSGNLYWTFGLDIDIFKYWGIGVKYIIHDSSFGESEDAVLGNAFFTPSKNQVRVSTYFVF